MSTADNLLRSGHAAVEGYGFSGRSNALPVGDHEPLHVEESVPDDYETFQIYGIGKVPVLIADVDRSRTKVQVQNLSDGFVYVGKRSMLTNVVTAVQNGGLPTGNGWRLGGSQSLSMEHTGAVYAVGDGTGVLSVYIERNFS